MLCPAPSRVLLVEDHNALAKLYLTYLGYESYVARRVGRGAEALAAIAEEMPDAILLDLRLPDMDGLEVLRRLSERPDACAVVAMTAHGSIETAVEAMRLGAYDFLTKPFAAERLLVTLRNAVERTRLHRMVSAYRDDFATGQYCGFIGASRAMQAVYRTIESVAPSSVPVFITGESGAGKEVCAEAIHAKSRRHGGPFVALDCAAIPKDLIESEIFGHVKGAFTGAVGDRPGAAERAHGGTLFLDEICELPIDLQAKLLRFAQTGAAQKVGGSGASTYDVRFVSATNRDPRKEVAMGRFREDLFYRLHVVPIALPPLRERERDAIAIAYHTLARYAAEEGKRFGRFTPEAEALLLARPWPGNVRELMNLVRQAIVLNDGEAVTGQMLGQLGAAPGESACVPSPPSAGVSPPMPMGAGLDAGTLKAIERAAIEQALAQCGGVVSRAAALLGVSPSTIYRKRQAWVGAEDRQPSHGA